MLQPGVIPKGTKVAKRCRHCCEICHKPTQRMIMVDRRPRLLCRKCDKLRRKRLRGKDAPYRWHSIYYRIEGEAKRYRCEHGAGLFVIASINNHEANLVCVFGYCHQVLNGFGVGKED